jgi:hypothetical protein
MLHWLDLEGILRAIELLILPLVYDATYYDYAFLAIFAPAGPDQ